MDALANFRRLIGGLMGNRSELVAEIERQRARIDTLAAAKAAAERANEAKSEFLAKMSHEMRTPLNALLSYSEQLLEKAELEGRGEAATDLRKISAAGQHVLGMVNDILDISRIETGKQLLNVDKGQQVIVPVLLHR